MIMYNNAGGNDDKPPSGEAMKPTRNCACEKETYG
jgi:hypothetical protein